MLTDSENLIYLDYNATTPIDPRVLERMMPYLSENFGNPSSIHSPGSFARAAIDVSREKVSHFLHVKPSEVVFTSGGSEANNFALKGLAHSLLSKGNHLVTTTVEHASCLETFRFLEQSGFEITRLPVDSFGIVSPEQFRQAVTDRTILFSCMYVNNETGVISPIREIGEIAREKGIVFHTDAVQSIGKIEINFSELPVDVASFSSHKIYGPKGVGALYIRKGVSIEPLVHGGGQERGKRSGTENVAAIFGFGSACEILSEDLDEQNQRLAKLCDRLFQDLRKTIDGAYLNGHAEKRVANTLNMGFPGVAGDAVVMNLDAEGIAVSTGSACSEGNVDPSHVLLALGLEKQDALCSVRFSLGRFTTRKDIDRITELLPPIVERIRKLRNF